MNEQSHFYKEHQNNVEEGRAEIARPFLLLRKLKTLCCGEHLAAFVLNKKVNFYTFFRTSNAKQRFSLVNYILKQMDYSNCYSPFLVINFPLSSLFRVALFVLGLEVFQTER